MFKRIVANCWVSLRSTQPTKLPLLESFLPYPQFLDGRWLHIEVETSTLYQELSFKIKTCLNPLYDRASAILKKKSLLGLKAVYHLRSQLDARFILAAQADRVSPLKIFQRLFTQPLFLEENSDLP